ncbi:hypothetical protein AURDEDRAFT_110146 [Auricularia subglabra TFB-10046 SS5]|nr:hypothetical protein AURDEDRAFT_110146 [Auricularia subglabra TFB-10046 SS5]
MTTRSRRNPFRWSSFLPVLVPKPPDEKQHDDEAQDSFARAQAQRWAAFEAAREHRRTQFEDAELARYQPHREREDAFRVAMRDLHSQFIADEEARGAEYADQEQLLEDAFNVAEEARERVFERDEERRDQQFIILYSACEKHAQWHADLRQKLFTAQEDETQEEWTKLEALMKEKFENLRATLNMEVATVASDRNRPPMFNVKAATFSESSDDLRVRFPGTKSISPVILPRGLPDEDSILERGGPPFPMPQPIDTTAPQPPPNFQVPFPRTDPISPVLMSTPSRRARSRSPARMYSSTEPRGSTNAPSRSPSPPHEMPPLPDILADFPDTPGVSHLPPTEQFAALQLRQATIASSDLAFFATHFSQSEAERDVAAVQRHSFFQRAEDERERWFRALEEQRDARSADAEFARRDGEERRSRTFEDNDGARTWRTTTAQTRFEREYEAAKTAHMDRLIARQTRLVHLAEVHRHVIGTLRLRVALLRAGAPTPNERAMPYGQRAEIPEPRARGPLQQPHSHPPPPPPAPPVSMPAHVPMGAPSPDVPRYPRRTAPAYDSDSPTSSRARNRHSRSRWRSSFYLLDAVEFVPQAILKKPAVRVALPVITNAATMVASLDVHGHNRKDSSQPAGGSLRVRKKERRASTLSLPGRPAILSPEQQFQAARQERAHAFRDAERARKDAYARAEQRRAAQFAEATARRTEDAANAAAERARVFADGQRARLHAGKTEEARRRAAAAEWAQRRAVIFAKGQIAREEVWRRATAGLHAHFVDEMTALSDELMGWQRTVMMEYESELPFAQAPPVQ